VQTKACPHLLLQSSVNMDPYVAEYLACYDLFVKSRRCFSRFLRGVTCRLELCPREAATFGALILQPGLCFKP